MIKNQCIPTTNHIKKIAYGIFQCSYVITGVLSEIESLYCYINQGFGILFNVWFTNESVFTNYKHSAKLLRKFRDLMPTGIGLE